MCPPVTQLATLVRMGRVRVRLTGRSGMQSGIDIPTNRCMLKQIMSEWVEECIRHHLDLIEECDLAWLADVFSNGAELFIFDGSYQPDL